MKNQITKLACFAIVTAALIAVPAISRADDSTNAPAMTDTNAPASSESPAPKKHSNVFHGKVASVDATAMTFTVGTMTATVTSATKITKNGQPAVFADITVGETVACAYKKDDSGTINATSVRIGGKKKAAAAQ